MTLSRYFSISLVTVALSFSLSAACHADSLAEANRLMKKGQQTQALEQVDKHLADQPKDPQGRFLKGIILTELNRATEAIAIFQKLTEDYPELPEPYNNMAVIYAQQKQYEKAKQALEMAIRTHPAYATAHENLGDIYARMASQAYDKALQIDSSNTSAQTKLSMIRDLVGRPTASAAASKTVVADAKPLTSKPAEAKPVEVKPIEPKPVEVKPAEAKPAEVKPAEAKLAELTATRAANGSSTADVSKAVQSWAMAWSSKDVKGYLAHYAKDFKTPSGMSRTKWESERALRVGKPGSISVDVDDLRVTAEGADKATVQFHQNYRSAGLNSASSKTLTLVHQDGKWLIQQERVGK
jgi:tetratricopeptide (TPR) repeat protein